MKRYMLAPIVGVVVTASVVRAATPTENECGAASRSAKQLRSAGNLSAARARLAGCLSTGCSSQLREECARHQAAIVAAMPAVVLEAKDEVSNNVSAVRVTMDGAPLLDRLDGTAILVDPGEHRVAFEAAGFRRAEATFVARESQKNLRVVVYLASGPSPAPNHLTVAASAPGRQEEPTSFAGQRQNVGLALGCAGIGGVAVGTIWSIMSKVTYDHALASECGGDPNRCSSQGIADGQTAHRQASISTIGFVTAGALFAAGAALYFTSSEQAGVAVAAAVDPSGGLTVVGKW